MTNDKILFPDADDLNDLEPGEQIEVEWYPEGGTGLKSRVFTVDRQGPKDRVYIGQRRYLHPTFGMKLKSTKTYQLDANKGRIYSITRIDDAD